MTQKTDFFMTSIKIKQNNSQVFSLVDQKILVNTMVPSFHALNLLHIQKKKKARIKFMNFSQNIWLLFFWVTLYIYIYIKPSIDTFFAGSKVIGQSRKTIQLFTSLLQ